MFFCGFFFGFYLLLLIFFCFSYRGGGVLLDYLILSLSGFDISFCVVFDYVSLGFFCCVSFICSMVFLYGVFYMQGSVDLRRFGWLVFCFVLSMFILVFSGNFFLTLVGWDGLGLVSFCLVVFYSNHGSLESGLVTVFSNRFGDVFFLMCFFFYFLLGGFTFDSSSKQPLFVFFVFLFLGAITKSAQLPFSSWLPAAMAAPTPVSSLVHSSTLVTAGVYVLIRFFYLFFFFNFLYFKLFFVLTMAVAGICANVESDFKKVVAMSTLSQLGMMLFILSVGVWLLSFLHMVIHAFFKSMLFLSTGSLMSHQGGGQDCRFYGSSSQSFFSFLFFFVSSVCLAGFPFYVGFYSKDFILVSSSLFLGIGTYLIFLGGCIFTILYSIRLIFFGYCYWVKGQSFSSIGESENFVFPVAFLFFKGWLLGGFFYWLFLSQSVLVFSSFDMLVGVVLILFSLFFQSRFFLLYRGAFYFCAIAFLRWVSSGGSSFVLGKKIFHEWDGGWMEMAGGQGVSQAVFSLTVSLDFYKKMGLGVTIIFVLLFSLGLIL